MQEFIDLLFAQYTTYAPLDVTLEIIAVIFGYVFTGSFKGAGILGLGSIIPLFFYYFHERIWNKVKWGLN